MGASDKQERFYDVVIVGGGPAGLSAAIYLARACYRVLVIEKEQFGGQITITSEVVNYPGIALTDGKTLTETMRLQAQKFGASFLLAEVTALELKKEIKTITTTQGDYTCFGVLLATGAHPRRVGFKGEKDWRGHGVAYCATCDGEFFTGKELFVIGGGFSAAQESVFLTKYASHVTILIRGEDFSCAKSTADTARNHPKITVLTNTVVDFVDGDSVLQTIQYHNTKTGEVMKRETDAANFFGVFVFAGYAPATELFSEEINLDKKGYILTNRSQQTNLPGVYAAGDVCQKSLRQVITAVGDGATAATELEKYATEMTKKTGLKPNTKEQNANKDSKLSSNATSNQSETVQKNTSIFSGDVLAQLDSVFTKMEQTLLLELHLDDKPISKELQQFITALTKQTDKLKLMLSSTSVNTNETPCVRILREDGTDSGIAFHGVPGGHEFNSFILGLYNVAGPGQPLDEAQLKQIHSISTRKKIQILVTLSCSKCPDLVIAAQHIAAKNPLVTVDIYDVLQFPTLKEKYNVMGVPCLILNETQVSFGKKNMEQLLELLKL